MHLDLNSNTKTEFAISPASYSAGTDNSAAIDVKDYRVAKIVGAFGTMGADATINVQESDDGTTGWATVTGGSFVFASGTYADGGAPIQVDCSPRKRYIRVALVTTTACFACINVELSPAKDTRYVAVDKTTEQAFILS